MTLFNSLQISTTFLQIERKSATFVIVILILESAVKRYKTMWVKIWERLSFHVLKLHREFGLKTNNN